MTTCGFPSSAVGKKEAIRDGGFGQRSTKTAAAKTSGQPDLRVNNPDSSRPPAMQVVKRTVAHQNDERPQRMSALSMYAKPPMEQISVTEFEDYALDRLRRECAPSPHPAPAHPRAVGYRG